MDPEDIARDLLTERSGAIGVSVPRTSFWLKGMR
jgi:hypothetical protein